MRWLIIAALLVLATTVRAESVEQAAMRRSSPVGLHAVAAGGAATTTTGKAMKRVMAQVNKSRFNTSEFGKILFDAITTPAFEKWREDLPKAGQAVAFTGLLVQAEAGAVSSGSDLALVVPASEAGYRFTTLAVSIDPTRAKPGALVDVVGRVFGTADYVDSEGLKRTAVLVVVPTLLAGGELQRLMKGVIERR